MAIDWSKPIECVDGRKARVLCTDAKGDLPVKILVDNGAKENCFSLTLDGMHGEFCHPSKVFVRNVPEKFSREVWVNVYRNCVFGFTSKYDAVSHAEKWLLACIRVPITGHVGQFDE